MPYIKLITGEVLHVAEKTAERVKNNRSSLHIDKATGIRFAGEHVVLIYPDEYDLVPTVERLPDNEFDKNVAFEAQTDMGVVTGEIVEGDSDLGSLNPNPITGSQSMTIDEHNREPKMGALPKKPGRPKKK